MNNQISRARRTGRSGSEPSEAVSQEEAMTLNLPLVLRRLGRPSLTKGEKLEDYYNFMEELAHDLNVTRFCEWLIVEEIARLKWTALRLRRAEAGLFDLALVSVPVHSDYQVGLGTGLRNNIDTIERSSRLILDYERRCDLLMRNLQRLQTSAVKRKKPETIDLDAEEVDDE
jgi:hypothetical protein